MDGAVETLWRDALAFQSRDFAGQVADDEFNTSLLQLHAAVTTSDLTELAAHCAEATADERILFMRVAGEAKAEWSPSVEDMVVGWLEQPVSPPLLTWTVARLAHRQDEIGRALAPLIRLVGCGDPEVEYALSGTLVGYAVTEPDGPALDALILLAGSDDEDVRFGAVFELHSLVEDGLHDDRAHAIIEAARKDDSDLVRRALL